MFFGVGHMSVHTTENGGTSFDNTSWEIVFDGNVLHTPYANIQAQFTLGGYDRFHDLEQVHFVSLGAGSSDRARFAYDAGMTDIRKPARVVRSDEVEAQTRTFRHPWNPRSEMRAAWLGGTSGLTRTGVNLLRLPPGGESFTYHAHLHEEEWIYLVSGRAVLDDGDAQHELAAGDFVAFPTPSQPHQLRNPYGDDVVYLSGGERAHMDVADFPRLGKRLVRIDNRATVYDLDGGAPLPFPGFEPL